MRMSLHLISNPYACRSPLLFRRELSALTLELIMTLNMKQILNLRHSFESHGGVVSVAQFVAIMASHLDVNKLKATPDMVSNDRNMNGRLEMKRQWFVSSIDLVPIILCFSHLQLIRSLVELFDSMDLDGDGELEFEELLTTVVHMGMAATEHLLLTPISSYREGPQYLVSMHQIDRTISFIKEREAICVVDSGAFAFRLYDPAMKYSLAVELPLSSALSVVYVTGVQVDAQQHQQSYKRSSVAKASYYTSGAPSASAERAKARALADQQSANLDRSKSKDVPAHAPMWDKISGMPLSKPMRMEHGQPMTHKHVGDDDEKDPAHRASSQLFSEYAAKPYYGSGSSLHAFTPAGSGAAGSSASSSSGRTPLVFIHEDYLVTSTSQYLQIWDGFPTGPATLCDSRKIKHSYSCLKWCPILQRLFAGDVLGNIDVWKIVLLPTASTTMPPNKPTLQKERELTGHTDIITGLESISSMGFLLSSSLDASVRMFDLQAGVSPTHSACTRSGFASTTVAHTLTLRSSLVCIRRRRIASLAIGEDACSQYTS
jgi:Ca2+-binding EF-hand superfamily protein